MRKKIIGVILVIIGIYLVIAVLIISIFFNQVYDGASVDLLEYLSLWLTEHGWFDIILILIGVIFISYGYSKLKKNSEELGISFSFFIEIHSIVHILYFPSIMS